jgi:hypothetical protein
MYDDSGATDRSMTQVLPLPNWSSLKRTKNDPVLVEALRRTLVPAVNVIVDGSRRISCRVASRNFVTGCLNKNVTAG